MKATAEMNTAYRAGLCVGLCGAKHSAGRPFCSECFAKREKHMREGIQ